MIFIQFSGNLKVRVRMKVHVPFKLVTFFPPSWSHALSQTHTDLPNPVHMTNKLAWLSISRDLMS